MEQLQNSDIIFLALKALEENNFRKKTVFTDLVLKSSDGFEYHAHKIILVAASPFFKSVLLAAGECETTKHIECPMEGDSLQDLLEYIYTGLYDKKLTSIKEAKKLYEDSSYFKIEHLQKFAIQAMSDRISVENSLSAYRYAIKYQIEDLADNCIILMVKNIVRFFNNFLLDLKYEEIEAIIGNPNLIISQDILYFNIIKWIKHDYDNRQCYLEDLLENVNFALISDKLILTDNILLKKHNFIYKIMNDFKKQHEEVKKQENNLINLNVEKKIDMSLNDYTDDVLLMVAPSEVFKLDKNNVFHKISKPNRFSMQKGFTSVPLSTKLLMLLGGDNSSVCKIFQIKDGTIYSLPKMIEKRRECEAITFNISTVYACGGLSNNGSIEYLKYGSFKWLSGPPMIEKKHKFGLVECRNSIYTFGGFKTNKFTPSHCVERYDPRIACWEREQINMSNYTMGPTKSLLINDDDIFCVSPFGSGQLFDVRQNRWRNDTTLIPPFTVDFCKSHFSLVRYGKDIIVTSCSTEGKNNFFKYDIDRNSWIDVKFYDPEMKANFINPFELIVLSNRE